MAKLELNIFNKTRLKFNELYEDSISYLSTVYGKINQYFSNSSPFGQLLRVTLHLGRLILSYIEDSITELNILSASREQSIKGLAVLTGHNPSRGMAARGAIKLTYNNSNKYVNQYVTIPNYTKIKNNTNGLEYTIVLPSDNMKVLLSNSNSYKNVAIVQGDIKYQQRTGTGEILQSYNFGINSNASGYIDNYFINIYVNGEKWRTVESILDMGFNEKACIIKTGQTSGVDVFFGTGTNGAIPEQGSIILFEYLFTQGYPGNINMIYQNGTNNWEFVNGVGYLADGNEINLNEVLNISNEQSVLFGTSGESLLMTQLLAPHASRSFVLANKINYEYFLRRLNMFSVIDVIHGFDTQNDIQAEYEYQQAKDDYNIAKSNYIAQKDLTGADSNLAKDKYEILKKSIEKLNTAKINYENSKLDDNTVYLFLIPDITIRMNDTDNYFTCNKQSFNLSDEEKLGILDLIKSSGQQIITMDTQIITPKQPKFAINCFIQMWENYEFDNVKTQILSAISDYLINNTRRDRIPISDMIAVIEKINGVDSVSVMFDADANNKEIYGNNYGIDDYGDIILTRQTLIKGKTVEINDIMPIFRGEWYNAEGVYYSDDISDAELSPINITLRGISKIDSINKNISIYK